MSAPTSTETMMTEIWKEVLGVEHVGLDDDFYALGGTSLLSVQLLAAVRKRTDLSIRLAELARATTVREAAKLVDAAQPNPSAAAEPAALSVTE